MKTMIKLIAMSAFLGAASATYACDKCDAHKKEVKKECPAGCKKECCAKKKCPADCKKECCTKKK